MLPDNVLSSEAMSAPFRAWLRGDRDPYSDTVRGGTAIGNGSDGLDIQLWKGWLAGDGSVAISAESTDFQVKHPFNGLFRFDAGAKDLSIAFDNNMTPAAVVTIGSRCDFRWYDGTIANYATITLLNSRNAIIRTDDIRASSTLSRDIILSYIRDDVLYYRQLRDRFLIERALYNVHPYQRLYQAGMNEIWRFQWEFVWDPDLMRVC